MKITIKKTLRSFAIAYLLTIPFMSVNNCYAENIQPANINECVKRFLTSDQDKHLKFSEWVERFNVLINNNPQLKNFSNLLQEYKNKPATIRASQASMFKMQVMQCLMNHKNLVDKNTNDFIKKLYTTKALDTVLRDRLGR